MKKKRQSGITVFMAIVRFLGTGSSSGVPVIGCSCAVCSSMNEKNKRLRASLLVTTGQKKILIDPGPDIRTQILTNKIDRIDAVLITHTHFDHIGGLEELRAFNFKQNGPIDCLVSQESYDCLKKLFYYIFEPKQVGYTSKFSFTVLPDEAGSLFFCSEKIGYCTYSQNGMKVTGYRFGDLAYVTDIKEYPQSIFESLSGIKTLIISALRFTKSAIQFSIDEAIDFAKKTGAEKTYLMHMSHEVDYMHIQTLLPKSIEPAFDGLEVTFI